MKEQVKVEINTKDFLKLMLDDIHKSYNEMGLVGVENIRQETPVDTGALKEDTYSEIKDQLYFINEMEYAGFVELGTYKQTANPFMKRGIMKSLNDFKNIVFSRMKI